LVTQYAPDVQAIDFDFFFAASDGAAETAIATTATAPNSKIRDNDFI